MTKIHKNFRLKEASAEWLLAQAESRNLTESAVLNELLEAEIPNTVPNLIAKILKILTKPKKET